MSTPTQCYCGIDLGSDEYAYSVLVMVPWDRMGEHLEEREVRKLGYTSSKEEEEEEEEEEEDEEVEEE
ncbi:hypothetical protein Tco_0204307 [Tanacetum coccineum]